MSGPTSILNAKAMRSLVLAGGGMRVAYQAGVLIALQENDLNFSHVDGTSGGIFNTGMLISGLTPEQMADKWRSLKLSSFISGRKGKDYMNLFKMEGYADADNIRDKVFPHLGIDIDTINKHDIVNATFNVCHFPTKDVWAFPHTKVKEGHLLAGVSLPIFMPALQIDGEFFTDAVWIKDANLIEAAQQGSEEIWLIWAIGNTPTYLNGAFNQYVHMIEMSANGALLEEFRRLRLSHPKIRLHVIKPPTPLPLDPDFFFNKINGRELINMGYSHAYEYLHKRNPEGLPLNETATKCLKPQDSLSFRSTYAGQVKFEGKHQKIQLFHYLQLHQFDGTCSLKVYGSLKIGNEEISSFTEHISLKDSDKNKVLQTRSHFIWKEKNTILQTNQKLPSFWELIMGLGFKKITVKAFGEDGLSIFEATLHQSAWQRIKSLYYSNLQSIDKTSISKKLKLFKAISQLNLKI